MKILFIVTARGGSKGVPRKNIAIVGGKPLIAYKIISAQKSVFDKRIIVSTDDEEIANVARKYGAEVPFKRPIELSTDYASSIDVVNHAVNWTLENDNSTYNYVCLLEPSSPFLTSVDIDKAFEKLEESQADTLLGMKESEVCREFIFPLDEFGKLSFFYNSIKNMKSVRRQDQIVQYTMNGCIYAAKTDFWLKNKSFFSNSSIPYIMPLEQSIEVDTNLDLMIARFFVDSGLIDLRMWD